ncbi:hypothetical protein KIN20_013119 [Parelaphostrongylus tenuis]|uniref:Uncharacterized protein n=1 Tax=Parelaphostrongylus tenuis TaxID=148309 RepID=A0AAD5QME3_PARTN|nr:hypothetical protein KIN20_013119 [Parelaphostrongylus tenuis]
MDRPPSKTSIVQRLEDLCPSEQRFGSLLSFAPATSIWRTSCALDVHAKLIGRPSSKQLN